GHPSSKRDWSSDVCSSDLRRPPTPLGGAVTLHRYHWRGVCAPKNPWSRPEPVTEVRSQDSTESLWEESSPVPWLSPTVFRVHPDHALRTGGGWVVRVHHRTKEADADDLAATTSPSVRDHSVSRGDSCSLEDAPFFTPAAPLSPDLLLRIRTDQGRPGREHTETAVFVSTVSSGPG